jgi:hypothetical protein
MFGWFKNIINHFKKKREEDVANRQQALTDITRGMYHAASTTSAMLAQQYIRMIDQFFDKEDDGTLAAKMVKIQLGDDHVIMVPLVTLVAPKGLTLDEMKVHMSVQISEAKAKLATDLADDSSATRTSFNVVLSPKTNILGRKSDVTDIEMIFKAGEPPEGVMRIIEEYSNMIKPAKTEEINGAKIVSIGKGYGPTRGVNEAPEYAKAKEEDEAKEKEEESGDAPAEDPPADSE